ncbi:fungal-specific transcription factor domain-containing protein [Aspergillus caelatus]|uniref:Fungal-specific transcription factor domain-containing protein n=1 Tax=Aspergillus caelatus TaxID=61420 RepID=A0A5N6ZXY4_9EURO|nr:fungal-specific transcription factor domain-containing protein [Aspergillus caelatus]KAE8362447.1 fungal-specific transcription factor domain-containing protein [Aspergillus caelatus]
MPPRDTAERRSLRASKRVARAYINDLHERLATLQHRVNQPAASESAPKQLASLSCDNATPLLSSADRDDQDLHCRQATTTASRSQGVMEAKAPLTNPLAFHITDWVPGPMGRPVVFMGTSSSWAFARRVLGMTHEKLTGSSLFPDPNNLLFDDHVYDLKWDGNKANYPQDLFDVSNLPTPEFAKYLISAVKFHCGQLFYLLDEDRFMEQFAIFQQNPAKEARSSPLWFCHYLLILAFGKMFVVQSTRSQAPAGAEYFLQAMQCMPDFSFFDGDPIEKIQVMCCAALYLQSIHSRGPAYRMIGSALRSALSYGMYTEMHGICLNQDYVQRSSLVWWTCYALERRMSSLLGVPMGISEESISTSFPSISTHIQGSNVLEMQVMLCQILAKVDLTVYGSEGKLDSRYLSATQSVLRDIAHVTEQLNNSFSLYTNGSMSGTSRISAHLYIFQHQCIILTTRPLLYIFLQSKLGLSDPALMDWLQAGTVQALLHICVESAQQILRILSNLLEQGLLETFLPFDMDAASTSTISLLLAAAIDPSLLRDHSPWSKRAYTILDEMSARGNLSARLIRSELKQLAGELAQLAMKENITTVLPASTRESREGDSPVAMVPSVESGEHSHSLTLKSAERFEQHYELRPDQLMELANSLDLNSLTWPLPSVDDLPDLDL